MNPSSSIQLANLYYNLGLPAEADGIRRLFRRDREFRELCEDYRDCVAALEELTSFRDRAVRSGPRWARGPLVPTLRAPGRAERR